MAWEQPRQPVLKGLLDLAWDVREYDWLVKLDFVMPSLLSRGEQELWNQVKATDLSWADAAHEAGKSRKGRAEAAAQRRPEGFSCERFDEDWAALSAPLT